MGCVARTHTEGVAVHHCCAVMYVAIAAIRVVPNSFIVHED